MRDEPLDDEQLPSSLTSLASLASLASLYERDGGSTSDTDRAERDEDDERRLLCDVSPRQSETNGRDGLEGGKDSEGTEETEGTDGPNVNGLTETAVEGAKDDLDGLHDVIGAE